MGSAQIILCYIFKKILIDHKSLLGASPQKAAVTLLVRQPVSVLSALFFCLLCEQEFIMVLSIAGQ